MDTYSHGHMVTSTHGWSFATLVWCIYDIRCTYSVPDLCRSKDTYVGTAFSTLAGNKRVNLDIMAATVATHKTIVQDISLASPFRVSTPLYYIHRPRFLFFMGCRDAYGVSTRGLSCLRKSNRPNYSIENLEFESEDQMNYHLYLPNRY